MGVDLCGAGECRGDVCVCGGGDSIVSAGGPLLPGADPGEGRRKGVGEKMGQQRRQG